VTNQSRAALRKAGFRETESLMNRFREKRADAEMDIFLSLDTCKPVVGDAKTNKKMHCSSKINGKLFFPVHF